MARSLASAFLWCCALLMATTVARADYQSDYNECKTTLLQLTTCLSFVNKGAPKPTTMCCSNLKVVMDTKRKCLCVLIRYRDKPGFKKYDIDLDRAVGLPDACNIPANISECPELLGIDPNSPEGKIFTRHNSSSRTGSTPVGANRTGSGKQEESGSGGRTNYYAMGNGLAVCWWWAAEVLRGLFIASFMAILAG